MGQSERKRRGEGRRGVAQAAALVSAACLGLASVGCGGGGDVTLGVQPVTLSAGTVQTCAVTKAGGVKCWGDDSYGQLGDGTTKDSGGTPVDVIGLSSGVVAVSTGAWHTCALTRGGGVKCWGLGQYGQLGDGRSGVLPDGSAAVHSTTPVDVVGLSSGVVAISAGGSTTCALLVAGGVKCWGSNGYGQIGDGTTTDRSTPVDVMGLPGPALAVAAGGGNVCALIDGGAVMCWGGGVKCWGQGYAGQLGDGSKMDSDKPVNVVGL